MNSIDSNFSTSSKKVWVPPTVKGFELNQTESGTFGTTVRENAFYSS
jgi:hypothetical protein